MRYEEISGIHPLLGIFLCVVGIEFNSVICASTTAAPADEPNAARSFRWPWRTWTDASST